MQQSLFKTPLGRFRIIAFAEGVSFLLLLGIAMPLKYFAGLPLAVKYVGWVHGMLFILYIFSLLDVKISVRWTLAKTFLAFLASLIPFGTFALDSWVLKKEMK